MFAPGPLWKCSIVAATLLTLAGSFASALAVPSAPPIERTGRAPHPALRGVSMSDELDGFRSYTSPALRERASASATHPLDVTWSGEFALPGFDRAVTSLFPDSGRLLMGGSFRRVGSLEAERVVSWDGTTLTALPSNPAVRLPSVRTMIRWNGHLVVGGDVWGNCSASVAEWDGNQWRSLGNPYYQTFGLAVYRGELVAAGYGNGELNCGYVGAIARWDGAQWSNVIANDHLLDLYGMAALGDSLYIAGRQYAGYSVSGIHVWNGATMTVPGNGLQGTSNAAIVYSLLVHEGRLYAAGNFTRSGTTVLGSTIAVFDGSTWSPVGHATGVSGGLAVWNGALVANITVGGVARAHQLVAGEWSPIPSLSAASPGTPLASLGSRLVVAQSGDLPWRPRATDGVTAFDIQQVAWTSNMKGLIGSSLSVAAWNGQLVVAAPSAVGSGGHYVTQPYVAAWNGSDWLSLPTAPSMVPYKVLVDSTGALLCGGWKSPNGLVRRWDGVQWSTLGGTFNAPVSDLAFADGALYALGGFYGTGSLCSVARLADSAWVAPSGCGLYSYWFIPEDLAVSQGRLVVASGPMDLTCGGAPEAYEISAFFHDAASGWTYTWPRSSYGLNTPYWLTAAEFEGRVVFGGDSPEVCLAWDGAWHDMSAGARGVDVLQVAQSRLFGAGEFLDADSTTWVYGVGEWTGSRWKLLGSGMNGFIYALADYGGDLYAAGDFSWANGKPSFGIARWMGLTRLDAPADVPAALRLSAPRPNPASGPQRFAFTLPAASHVRLVIHDVAGRRVATLLDESRAAGTHAATWDGRDASGASAAPGTYFARLRTDAGEARTTVLRVK